MWHVPCGGAIYGDDNLVFIANDWHTALLPVYLQVRLCTSFSTEVDDVTYSQPSQNLLVAWIMIRVHIFNSFRCGAIHTLPHCVRCCLQAHYRDYGKMTYARSVFIIHNIAHQGRGPLAELSGLEVSSKHLSFGFFSAGKSEVSASTTHQSTQRLNFCSSAKKAAPEVAQ